MGWNFRSDNESGAAPEMLEAIARVNAGSAHSYGEDALSARLQERFSEIFECELRVFPVATGTAANALCMAQLCPPYGEAYCHAHSHLNTDECGAPEFFTGGAKLAALEGAGAKIDPDHFEKLLAAAGELGDHVCEPAALSLSQSTEFGCVYQRAEIETLCAMARGRGLGIHMDGARFANAVAALDCAPADLTWRAGVDLLSFGATKNGALAAEAVVVFDLSRAVALGRRRKRAGHLLSKMRFVSAQLEAYLADDLWLRHARHANRAAARLATGLAGIAGAEVQGPVEANEVFVRLQTPLVKSLHAAGFEFHRWPGTADLYRLVTAYNTPDQAVEQFLATASQPSA